MPILDNDSIRETPSSGPSPRTPTTDLPSGDSPSGKSTLRERQNTRGNAVREGDIGDGYVPHPPTQPDRVLTLYRFSTVRPVKNVDKVKTARLAAGYIGTGSVRRLSIPAEAPTPRRKATTDRGKAGEVLVDEVILGVLDSVSRLVRVVWKRVEADGIDIIR